ncbi:Do family serine endopeptidase [Polycladidibacter hongkongensis]|uniref:Do family serine endopeptidase n=1 Tax=Polycladidibacter hongkongensis TaxID=1647556 RepID=UPI00082AA825|nr:Do family serine endopeptidase [Pseudovibrio hongkongensis]
MSQIIASTKPSFLKRSLRSASMFVVAASLVAPIALTPVASQAAPVSVEAPQIANFSPVVKAVQPAVVSVRVKAELEQSSFSRGGGGFPPMFRDLPEDHPFKRFFKEFGGEDDKRGKKDKKPRKRYGQSQGSGFFISEDGYVVTNEHVVDNGTEFTVVMSDGTEHDAKLVGSDERSDLALLKVDTDETFTYVDFAEGTPDVGEWVIAVGNPFGLGGTVTAGIVSARGRDIGAGLYDDFLQIDASVNRGNSGGPAFNLSGQVVGVNSAIISPSGGNVGIAFAIPAATAKTIIADLKDDGIVTRGWLGVQIQPVTEDIAESLGLESDKGTLVAEIQKGTPAEKAKFKAGDIILKVDGKEVNGPRELAKVIAGYAPDSKVKIEFWRDGEILTKKVKLGTTPDSVAKAGAKSKAQEEDSVAALVESLGIEVASAKAEGAGDEGVVVTDVDPDSPAAEKGLRSGFIIVEVAGKAVNSAAEVAELVEEASENGRKAVLLRIDNGRGTQFVAIPLKK